MKIFLRILKYVKPYSKRFALGIIFSFFVSIFSGISLTTLKPIFDVLAQGNDKPFQVSLTNKDLGFLIKIGEGHRVLELYESHPMYEKKRISLQKQIEKMGDAPQADELLQREESIDLIKQGARLKLWFNLQLVNVAPLDLLYAVGLTLLPIYLLKLLCALGTVYFISSTGLLVVKDIRQELNNKVLRLSISHFIREKSGTWMSRVINDVVLISDAISQSFRISINNFFIVTTHLGLLAFLNYKLLLISVIGVPLLLWPVNHFARKIRHITTNEQSRLAELNGHMQEVLSGIRVIRAFGMEGYESSRFGTLNEHLYRQSFRYQINNQIGPSLVEFVSSFIVVGLLLYGGSMIVGGSFTAGSFFTFFFTLMMILSPLKQLATWYNLFNRTVAAGGRVFEVLDMEDEIIESQETTAVEKLSKCVHYKDVSFHYPGTEKMVLKNISVKVPVGSTVALVGHSGAGKSTFVDLLPRFYDVTEGSILFDDVDLRAQTLKEIRSKIGIVTQDIFLFNTTVRENIAAGRDDIELKEIRRAAKMAYADDFIMDFPKQYDTIVGERGLMLSGGQRQRLSIARALLKNPEILILDEATSALDNQSERLVQKALESLMKNRTTFVIAHRLSTIYKCDLILVFKDGKIAERGTHDELLNKSGLYRELYDMQFQV